MRFALRVFQLSILFGLGLLKAEASDTPNIVLIYTDDQGFGDASCLNPKAKFRTPNLDSLAARGLTFTNAHCSDTVCTPSRYGLLTGRYCWRTTRKTGVLGAEAECLIADGRETIATMLRRSGYKTAMVGKWHLGMQFPGEPGDRDWTSPVEDMPLDKGFDYFFGIPASLNYGVLAWFEGRHARVPPTVYTAKKPNQRHIDYRIMPPYQDTPAQTKKLLGKVGMEIAPDFVDNQCLTRFTQRAIDWMQDHVKQKKDQPFFLYLPLTSPHYPVCPLPDFWGQGECGGYGEFVIETDFRVGQILKFLRDAKIEENTLVVFTSDNGPERSWVQRVDEFKHRSNHIYRGGKRDIYEGGHRVPFFMQWPAGIDQPGRRIDALVGQTDLLATLAEIVGQAVPEDMAEDSQSFAGLLSDSDSKHVRWPLVNHGASGRFAVTEANWKLILPHRKSEAELYDLNADPGETRNVIADHPQLAKSLQGKLTEIVRRGRSGSGPVQSNDTGFWSDLTWMTENEYSSSSKADDR